MESKVHIQTADLQEMDVVVSHQETLLEALLKKGIKINHSCGGNGTCGTCRVIVTAGIGYFAESTDLEKEIILDRKFSKQERLSCQTHLKGAVSIQIPKI